MTSPDKVRDEKIEGGDARIEEEMGDVSNASHLTRQYLWKLDIR